MLIKNVLRRRDKLLSYIYSIAVAKNYCEKSIGDPKMTQDLSEVLAELKKEYEQLDQSLKSIESMEM